MCYAVECGALSLAAAIKRASLSEDLQAVAAAAAAAVEPKPKLPASQPAAAPAPNCVVVAVVAALARTQ